MGRGTEEKGKGGKEEAVLGGGGIIRGRRYSGEAVLGGGGTRGLTVTHTVHNS